MTPPEREPASSIGQASATAVPRAAARRKTTPALDATTRALTESLPARLAESFGDRLRAVLLFGSRARGGHSEDSDADVAIVLAGSIENTFALKCQIIDATYDLFLETGIVVQPWPLEEAWLEDPSASPYPHIVRAIPAEGIAL